MLSKKSISVLGSNIAYFDEGALEHPAVLLIHGFPESSLLWKDIIPSIVSSGYRAIAPDLPGFGDSDRFLNNPHTWENYITFVSSFLQSLQVDKIHLMLHDWGGLIGLEWARLNLDKILSLIVTDTVYCADYEWHDLAQRFQDLENGEIVIEKMADKTTWSGNMKQLIPSITPEFLHEFYRTFETTESRKVALELYRSGDVKMLANHKGEISRHNIPATIIWGENDPYASTDFAYRLKEEHLPNASVYIIPGVGHFIHIEAADAVSQIVKDHFDRLQRTHVEL